MPDVFSAAKRSEVMSRIRGSGNLSTELKLISLLKKHGIKGWRRRFKITGKPDFVFPKQRVAIFVDGSFWHGHPKHCRYPATNAAFWRTKIEGNKRRDRTVGRLLKAKAWRVIRIWEHDLKRSPSKVLQRLSSALESPPLQKRSRQL